MTAAVDAGQLLELVWAAAVAGVVVTGVFALVILGLTRASDSRRLGRGSGAGAAYLALALVAAVGFVGAVVFGVSIIVSK